MKNSSPFKAGYVAIIGRPNVGKSTLMNALLQQKIAIVTPKPQTTRHRILGILSGDDHQIIFLDTPGMMDPKYELQEAMLQTARSTIKEADLLMVMVEAGGLQPDDERVLAFLESSSVPKFMIINKMDTIEKKAVLPLIDHFHQSFDFEHIIPISALHGDGLDLLIPIILESLPIGEPLYPVDMVSDEPERFFVSEIIREQIFLHFGEEIPYSTTVHIEEFREQPGRKDMILANIYVERDSQKGILIGKGGSALKRIGTAARIQIESFLGRPVYLELRVRLHKKWRRDAQFIKRMGYR